MRSFAGMASPCHIDLPVRVRTWQSSTHDKNSRYRAMQTEPVIREYHPDDLPALKRITAFCFEPVSIDRNIEARFGCIGGRDWRWRKLRHIDDDVAGDRARGVFVLQADDQVVGYITTRVDRESRIGGIPNLAILPAYQGRGLGKQLIQTALDYLRAQNMECAKIETLVQNEVGASLYVNMGFEEVARQIHYLMRL